MIYIGVDPGKSGGVGWIDTKTDPMSQHAWAFSRAAEAEIAQKFSEFEYTDCYAFIEKVHSMPKQGVKSMFTFGQSYGFLRACLVCFKIPFEEVTSQKWMKGMGCMTAGDKNVTKNKACNMYPHMGFTHATADAMLIATYCMYVDQRTHGN
jgi:crossover junction endodeoxyribonuclease RuvC